MDHINLLVADDDKGIVEVLTRLLEQEGYHIFQAYNGIEVLEIIQKQEIHLILLDVMMPRMNGLTTMIKIREEHNIPIIILSAKTEESDIVSGLELGADDYIEKPFNTPKLLARVKAQLRRYMLLSNNKSEGKEDIIRNGILELDRNSKQINIDGVVSNLTATEYKIMELLMENTGRVFSSEQIYQCVWNEDAYSVENTVMIHIRRIREKIESDPRKPKYLKVVWGIGYKIEKM
ncbi:MAG TPA: response regulator transcription factor [Lachnospiraceae bacterium]|nr:response regulator transcription factor [Lachnospiraceae bacterium]